MSSQEIYTVFVAGTIMRKRFWERLKALFVPNQDQISCKIVIVKAPMDSNFRWFTYVKEIQGLATVSVSSTLYDQKFYGRGKKDEF